MHKLYLPTIFTMHLTPVIVKFSIRSTSKPWYSPTSRVTMFGSFAMPSINCNYSLPKNAFLLLKTGHITKPNIDFHDAKSLLSKRTICIWLLTHTFFSSCHILTHKHFHRSHKQVQLQIIHLIPTFWLTHYRQYLTEYLNDVAEIWVVRQYWLKCFQDSFLEYITQQVIRNI